MPKMKTSRAAAKRFTRTGTGKIRCNHSHKSHILTKKKRSRKRKLRKSGLIASVDVPRVNKMILT
ncbi:MAG: 50S ribosomal protein L35 [Candidatus Electryonea clarkiae]|nr:50S ribosomal protein L35 [Candidatus Electryonea clarkiae]MDP8287775.1 50S ribosomal protein L35 [Candidatus Electryonea clarkiae]